MMVINIGLSFLKPFVCLSLLLTGTHQYFRGIRIDEYTFIAFPAIMGISALAGIVNAATYYRKRQRS